MTYTPKEIKLCKRLHDLGVRPEIREGDWFFNIADKKGEKIFCSHRLIWITEPVREFFVLIFTWKRCREWLREKGWFLWSHYQFEGPVKIGFHKNPAEHKYDIEGATDLEAILSAMMKIAKEEKA